MKLESNIVCLEEIQLEKLIDKCVSYIKKVHDLKDDLWISGDEAMKLLGISSATTLGKMRAEGQIRYSQPWSRVILYDRNSILEFLEKHARSTF